MYAYRNQIQLLPEGNKPLTKKPKNVRKRKITRAILVRLAIFTVILIAFNIYMGATQIGGQVADTITSQKEMTADFFYDYITDENIADPEAAWVGIATTYLSPSIVSELSTPNYAGIYTLLRGEGDTLTYGTGVWTSGSEKLMQQRKSGILSSKQELNQELLNQLHAGEVNTYIELDPDNGDEDSRLPAIVACPVQGDQGKIIGYLCVEVLFAGRLYVYAVYMVYGFIALILELFFTLPFFLIVYFLIGRRVLKPLSAVEKSALNFVDKTREDPDPETWVFDRPKLKVHDEIDSLANSIQVMAGDMQSYMKTMLSETRENERISTELNLAARIQQSMLTTDFPAYPERSDFDVYASMVPAKEVAGDFYDFFLIDDDHLALVMADVSGKGVPASMYMMVAKTLLHNVLLLGHSPKECLETVNDQIGEHNEENMFVTVWLGILELSTGIVTAANAGHEYPIIRHADGQFEVYKDKHGIVLGAMPHIKYRQYEFQMEKGSTLFLYTDGAPEAINAEEKLFGMDRVLEALNQEPDAAPDQLLKNVENAINVFVGEAPQFDDLTMMAVKLSDESDS